MGLTLIVVECFTNPQQSKRNLTKTSHTPDNQRKSKQITGLQPANRHNEPQIPFQTLVNTQTWSEKVKLTRRSPPTKYTNVNM